MNIRSCVVLAASFASRCSRIGLLLFFSTVLALIGLVPQGFAASSTLSPAQNSAMETVERSILDNIKQNGFDSDHSINNGLGGLWINWRYGTNPLLTNFNGHAAPDGSNVAPIRHDPLTDLRYLHVLWLFKEQHPPDGSYDADVLRYSAIVKAEYANAHDRRGWLFDEEFMDLYRISHDPFFQNAALSLATTFSKSINPAVGISYDVSADHPQGYYRVDNVLEEGCALIQAGKLFNNPLWSQQGQAEVNFVYTHAYIPQYHTFTSQMDQVLTADGAVNPVETFYTDTFRSYDIQGNMMRMGALSEITISLLHTFQITGNPDFLQKARELLDTLSLPRNALGMWDATNLGYYNDLVLDGLGPQTPGAIKVDMSKKEAGSQTLMLWAFHLANMLTNHAYQNMEDQMLNVALNKAYYAPGHGVLYQVRADWTPNSIGGLPLDWVTTEAMGSELESLFNAGRTN